MPDHGLLSCAIELGDSNLRLREYGTTYHNLTVETYVAIPSNPTPFGIRLNSYGYIAPGLSIWVFIDGVYQTNRNKREIVAPSVHNPHAADVEFRVGQKEDLLREGRVISRGWWFEKLNIVAADTNASVHEDVLNNIGTIEVVVLRCEDDPTNPTLNPWDFPQLPNLNSSNGDDRRGTQSTKKKKKSGVKKPTKRSDSGNNEDESEIGGFFGIFDGAGDCPRQNCGMLLDGQYDTPHPSPLLGYSYVHGSRSRPRPASSPPPRFIGVDEDEVRTTGRAYDEEGDIPQRQAPFRSGIAESTFPSQQRRDPKTSAYYHGVWDENRHNYSLPQEATVTSLPGRTFAYQTIDNIQATRGARQSRRPLETTYDSSHGLDVDELRNRMVQEQHRHEQHESEINQEKVRALKNEIRELERARRASIYSERPYRERRRQPFVPSTRVTGNHDSPPSPHIYEYLSRDSQDDAPRRHILEPPPALRAPSMPSPGLQTQQQIAGPFYGPWHPYGPQIVPHQPVQSHSIPFENPRPSIMWNTSTAHQNTIPAYRQPGSQTYVPNWDPRAWNPKFQNHWQQHAQPSGYHPHPASYNFHPSRYIPQFSPPNPDTMLEWEIQLLKQQVDELKLHTGSKQSQTQNPNLGIQNRDNILRSDFPHQGSNGFENNNQHQGSVNYGNQNQNQGSGNKEAGGRPESGQGNIGGNDRTNDSTGLRGFNDQDNSGTKQGRGNSFHNTQNNPNIQTSGGDDWGAHRNNNNNDNARTRHDNCLGSNDEQQRPGDPLRNDQSSGNSQYDHNGNWGVALNKSNNQQGRGGFNRGNSQPKPNADWGGGHCDIDHHQGTGRGERWNNDQHNTENERKNGCLGNNGNVGCANSNSKQQDNVMWEPNINSVGNFSNQQNDGIDKSNDSTRKKNFVQVDNQNFEVNSDRAKADDSNNDQEKKDPYNGDDGGWNNDDNQNDTGGWDNKTSGSKSKSKKSSKSRQGKAKNMNEDPPPEAPYTRSYWKSPLNNQSSRPDSSSRRYFIPEEPIYTIPESRAKEAHIRHQVRGGKGSEHTKKTYKPIYWDTFDKPYAVFRFKYRSRDMLKEILDQDIKESAEEFKERLTVLSKEELIAEMLRKKEAGSWSSDEGGSSAKINGDNNDNDGNFRGGDNSWDNDDGAGGGERKKIESKVAGGGWNTTAVNDGVHW